MLSLPSPMLELAQGASIRRVYLVEIALAGGTLCLSYPIPWTYRAAGAAEQWYDDLISNMGVLGQAASYLASTPNSPIRLTFRNHLPVRGYSRISDLFDADPVENKRVDIWELFYTDVDQIYPVDLKLTCPHWVYYADQIERAGRQDLVLPLSNIVYAYDDRLPLKKITAADFPYADPDDIGRYRNMVYGANLRVPCLAIDAGPADTCRADHTAGQTDVWFSDADRFALFSNGDTVQIDNERIHLGTKDAGNRQFWGCTRAYGGTTATAHSRGKTIFKVQSEYKYEIACHLLKTVSYILVDGVLVESGYHLDTGGGTHQLHFTVKPIIQKQVAITAATDTGSHGHSSPTLIVFTKRGVSASGPANANNAIDGSTATGCVFNGETLSVTLESGTYGNLQKIVARPIMSYGPNRTDKHIYVYYNNILIGTVDTNQAAGINPSPFAFTYETTTWSTNFKVEVEYDADGAGGVWEVEVDFYYTAGIDSHAADGVDVTLGGNSSADVVVGGEVIAICDGYADDGGGTYTGTPNALIERPDHVVKHLLQAQVGLSAGLVDVTAAGTFYGTKGYKFAFLLQEVATRLSGVMSALAREARSFWGEKQGKVTLIHWPDSAPGSADLILDEAAGVPFMREPEYGKNEVQRVRNEIYVHYERVYSRDAISGVAQTGQVANMPSWKVDPGSEYDSAIKVINAGSQTKYGARLEEITLAAVRDDTHAADWAAWMLVQLKEVLRTVEVVGRWDARALEVGDYINVLGPFWTTVLWRVMRSQVDPNTGFQQISAVELVVP